MPIVIDINVGDKKVDAAFARLDAQLAKLDAHQAGLNQSLAGTANLANVVARGYSNVATQAGRAQRNVAAYNRTIKAPPRLTSQPITSAAHAQSVLAMYGPGAMAGDYFAARMVNKANSAIRAQQRAQKSLTPQDPIQAALARTRFVQQGSQLIGMPLGRDLGLLQGMMGSLQPGLAGMAGGVGGAGGMAFAAPLMIAGAAAIGLAAALKQGKAAADAHRAALIRNGGTAAQAGAAARLEQFTGVSASGIFSNAGGLSAAVMASMGVNPVRGPFGEMNDSRDYIKILDQLRRMPFDQARRKAAMLGDKGLASVALLSGDTYGRLSEMHKRDSSMRSIKTSAEFDANMTIFTSSLDRFLKVVGTPLLGAGARGMDQFVRMFEMTTPYFERWGEVMGLAVAPLSQLVSLVERLTGRGGRNESLDKNTKAINDWRNEMRNGTYGGGRRANGAFPRNIYHGVDPDLRERNNFGLA